MKFEFTKLYMKSVKVFKFLKLMVDSLYYTINSTLVRICVFFERQIPIFVRNISVTNSENFNIAFLGKIKSDYFATYDKLNNTLNLLDSPDILFYYADDEENSRYIDDSRMVNLQKHDRLIFEFNNAKVGIIKLDFNGSENIKHVKKQILKEKSYLLKQKCNYLIAVIKSSSCKDNDIAYKKLAGMYGFDYIIGYDDQIYTKRNFRSLNFNSTRIMYSLGSLVENKNEIEKCDTTYLTSIALRIELSSEKNKSMLLKEGFIPVYVSNAEIYYMDNVAKKYSSDEYKACLNHIYKKMRGFRNWYDIYTVGDIAEQLNVEIPDKYKIGRAHV